MELIKKFICISIITLIGNVALSQSDNAKYIEFKLYKNAEFNLGQTQATRTVTLGTFSPAIAWGKGVNFHEIQLLSLNFKSRARAFSYSAGAEYTYNHRVTDGETRLRFYIGGGIGSGFSTNYSSIVSPISGNTISTTGKEIFFHAVVIPRITYAFRKNILLDLSVPYHLYDFRNTQSTAADPAQPTLAQTVALNTNTILPRVFSVKLGGIVLF